MQVTKAKLEDVSNIIDFFKEIPEVSYDNWQDNICTTNIIKSETSIVYILWINKKIEGVIFGGIMGSRATINHYALGNNFRNKGLGKILYNEFVKYIKSKNICKIFLFVDKDNKDGLKFWENMNFKNISNEITMEKLV